MEPCASARDTPVVLDQSDGVVRTAILYAARYVLFGYPRTTKEAHAGSFAGLASTASAALRSFAALCGHVGVRSEISDIAGMTGLNPRSRIVRKCELHTVVSILPGALVSLSITDRKTERLLRVQSACKWWRPEPSIPVNQEAWSHSMGRADYRLKCMAGVCSYSVA